MKIEITREQLIDFIAKNNGFTEANLEQFTTKELQDAYNDTQGPYIYLNALIATREDNKK